MSVDYGRTRGAARPATARQRRLRERQRLGLVVVPVPVSVHVVEILMDLRWLPEQKSEDRSEIGDAVARMLEELAASQRNKV
ncbi:hypothetical protein EDC65_0318 [Stella humosa]|uniref:Uncharacterized protein n=1 Tax=Stella humosa TaxID=94 RepID=A0A3N1MBN3_9PROT|nr:hypothetical protein [Stella humosa]ROQ01141.1 hypothetical protein EDC65_0318 [Stella humosa]BBK31515.1 hypothetical protein STHU_21490 [Stella humosa]